MKKLELTALQRSRTAIILEQRGPEADVRQWCKILDQIELTEAELAVLRDSADKVTGALTLADFALIPDKTVEFEDAQCAVLLVRLKKFEPLPSEFRAWYGDLIDQFGA
jgi:hypothetical protein